MRGRRIALLLLWPAGFLSVVVGAWLVWGLKSAVLCAGVCFLVLLCSLLLAGRP